MYFLLLIPFCACSVLNYAFDTTDNGVPVTPSDALGAPIPGVTLLDTTVGGVLLAQLIDTTFWCYQSTTVFTV